MTKNKFTIPFDSERHRTTLSRLMRLFRMSRDRMTERHSAWKKAEDLFRAYLPETEVSRKQSASIEKGGSELKQVFIPYSYAMALTTHAYATSVFIGRDPVWQYQGRHGETQQSVLCLEALMAYNQTVGGLAVQQFVWLLDPLKYGIGVVTSDWEKQVETFSEFQQAKEELGGVAFGEDKWDLVEEMVEGYCGNVLQNVRPYDFYPDPRVPLVDFQKGEFCSHTTLKNLTALKSMEEALDLFNLEELQAGIGGEMKPSEDGSRDNMLAAQQVWNSADLKAGGVGLWRVVVDLIPKDWGLPTKFNTKQKWEFLVANNKCIVQARPLGLRHCKFPYDVISYEVDGYDVSTRGMMEITRPLNEVMNWLFNTHFFSVRRSLNGNMIVDPNRVNIKDLIDGGPGRIVRLKPEAYGTDVRSAFAEMLNVDPTRGHLGDSQYVAGLSQMLAGSNDTLMGNLGKGRKTATEVRSAASSGMGRMKTYCDFASALGWSQLSRKMIANCQQFYDGTKMFRIAGDLFEGTKFVNVDKSLITGEFDWVPVDGTLPVDRFAQATLWKEIMMGLAKSPQLAAGYDMTKIFAHMAKLAGLKNIDQMRLQVVPDQVAQQMMQSGNGVPLGAGGGSGGYPGDSPSAAIGSMVAGSNGA
jgi:hypothetical protein